MRFFDLHCDTPFEIFKKSQGLYENSFHVSIKKSRNIKKYIGCFAIWMPDEFRGDEAINFFNKVYQKFETELSVNSDYLNMLKNSEDLENVSEGKVGIILTVEGGSALGGKLSRVKALYEQGVRVMTLTWNGSNEIGGGNEAINSRGITAFGEKVLTEMEKYGIIVDISHASQKLFFDVSSIAQKPFIATHSNAFSVCKHPRNLTDEQFSIIRRKNGLVGLTFCKHFLKSDGEASIYDIMKHMEHFLSLSGEKTLAIGSDFDGTDMPIGIEGVDSMENLYECLLRHNYNEELVNDIFYNNAYNFFENII